MNVLIDTHALLWFYIGDPQLSSVAHSVITDPSNAKFVSPACYWELAIKISLGKYTLHETYDDFIQHAVFDNGFLILPIEPKHASATVSLPWHHKDPFDRLMVAQTIVEGMSFVSRDSVLDNYSIKRIW